MKKRWIGFLFFTCLMAACTGQPTAAPATTPASAETVPAARGEVVASAEVVPAQVSELSFPISGLLKEVNVRPGDQVRTGQTLALLDLPEQAFVIRQAEADLLAAQTDLDYYSQERTKEFKPPERLQAAEARLVAAQAALQTARLTQSQAALAAPFDGTVISVDLKVGEIAHTGQVFILMAGLDSLQIETTDLSERNIAQVEVGQPAVVYIESLDQEFGGQVIRVAPIAGKKDGDVVFTVTIALDEEQPPALRWGMSAEVRIKTGE